MMVREKRELATGETVAIQDNLFAKCYKEEEFQALLEAALRSRLSSTRLQNYILVGIGGWCGTRASEARGIQVRDILPDRMLQIVTLKQRKNHKGETRLVPIEKGLYLQILIYIQEKGLKPKDRLFPFTLQAVEQRMSVLCKNARIPDKAFKGLRHRFCSYFAKIYSSVQLAALTGHQNPAMLMVYYHGDPKQIRELYDEAAEGKEWDEKKRLVRSSVSSRPSRG